MTQYGFFYDATRCTGCKTCELACKDYKDLPVDFSFRHVYEVEGGSWQQDDAGFWTTDSYTYYLSMSCNHCDEPACTHACPTGAMHKATDTGIVSVDEAKCIGCGYCAMACPYDAPTVSKEIGHSAKCNGCAERVAAGMQPICVEACSGRALFFAPIDELPSGEGRADIAPLPAEDFTGPNLYLKKCVSMQPVATDVAISNILEVM